MSNKLASRITNIRKSMKKNKKEFGELFDTTGSLVSKWESGKVVPSDERLEKIAELGNLTLDELVNGTIEERIHSIILQEVAKGILPLNEIALRETVESARLFPADFIEDEFKVTAIYLVELEAEIYVTNKKKIESVINEYVENNNLFFDGKAFDKTLKAFTRVYIDKDNTNFDRPVKVPPYGDDLTHDQIIKFYLHYSGSNLPLSKSDIELMEKISFDYLLSKKENSSLNSIETELLNKLTDRKQR